MNKIKENITLNWIEIVDILKTYQIKILIAVFLVSISSYFILSFLVPAKYISYNEIYELADIKERKILNMLLSKGVVSPLNIFENLDENNEDKAAIRSKISLQSIKNTRHLSELDFINQIVLVENKNMIPEVYKTLSMPAVYENNIKEIEGIKITEVYDNVSISSKKTDIKSELPNYDVIEFSFPNFRGLGKEKFDLASKIIFENILQMTKLQITESLNEEISNAINNYKQVLRSYKTVLRSQLDLLEEEFLVRSKVVSTFLYEQHELAQEEVKNENFFDPILSTDFIDNFTISGLYHEGSNILTKRIEQIQTKDLSWYKQNDIAHKKFTIEFEDLNKKLEIISNLQNNKELQVSDKIFDNLYSRTFISGTKLNVNLITSATAILSYILFNIISLLTFTYQSSRIEE